jgi:hypothetical protein
MLDQATLTQWLADAEQALHDLVTGVKAVTVSSSSGKSVTYTKADVGQLQAYITYLQRQLGISQSIGPLTFRIG